MSFNAKQLLHLYESGQISRRNFIIKSSILKLAGMLPAALLSTLTKAAAPKNGEHFSVSTVTGSSSETVA